VVRKLIEWAVSSPGVVILLAVALAAGGTISFLRVNVEAYPDPAPAIIEVVAQYPGASAEEVERLVTVPLEVSLAGMPGLKYTRSKSLFGLSHLRNQFDYGVDYYQARQEVINRLQFVQGLPAGVTPQISPMTPTGELMRYTLQGPRDPRGRSLYTLQDLKSLEDWTLEREFKRVPRVIDVTSFGGLVKRYEIRPDPRSVETLRNYARPAADGHQQQQRQRRRRHRQSGTRGHERPRSGPGGRRTGSHARSTGPERPVPGRRAPARRGAASLAPDARNCGRFGQ
jgi:Cu/Ag efflux pump CusA